eukprot:10426548-Alexandrium_andersonii.AAC.1
MSWVRCKAPRVRPRCAAACVAPRAARRARVAGGAWAYRPWATGAPGPCCRATPGRSGLCQEGRTH